MNTAVKFLPHVNVGARRPGWRLDAHEIPMTDTQVRDAKRRAAAMLAESAKSWPAEFRR